MQSRNLDLSPFFTVKHLVFCQAPLSVEFVIFNDEITKENQLQTPSHHGIENANPPAFSMSTATHCHPQYHRSGNERFVSGDSSVLIRKFSTLIES